MLTVLQPSRPTSTLISPSIAKENYCATAIANIQFNKYIDIKAIITLMMGTFNHLIWLIAQEDFIKNIQVVPNDINANTSSRK